VPRPTPEQIDEAFDLGGGDFQTWNQGGAYSHDVWSLRTARGDYVVKVFDTSVDHARDETFRTRMAEAIGIELAAIDAGVPAPRPVRSTTGDVLVDVDTPDGPALVRVHENASGWPADGYRHAPFNRRVGRTIAKIHALPIACPHDESTGLWQTHDDAYVAELADRAKSGGHAWAADLEALRGPWQYVRDLVEARKTRTWPLISTHRDLGPKNFLRGPGGGPWILDWDVAGPWTAIEELAGAAVEWAGVKRDEPARPATDALLDGYVKGGGTIDVTGPEVFASWLVKHANWTEMHIRHALDPDAPRRDRSREAVPWLLDEFARYTAGVEEWTRWLSE